MSTLSLSTLEVGPEEVRNVEVNIPLTLNLTNGHDQTPENELAELMDETRISNGVTENGYTDDTITEKTNGITIGNNSGIMITEKLLNKKYSELNGDIENLGFNDGIYTKDDFDFNIDDVNGVKANHLNEINTRFTKLNKISNEDFYNSKSADINHNADVKKFENGDEDSDNEKSESKSEVTLCASPMVATACRNVKSTETSTDTLVAETGVISG